MSVTPVLRGNTANKERPGYPRWTFEADGIVTGTDVYEGTDTATTYLTTLLAIATGAATWSGPVSGLQIDSAELQYIQANGKQRITFHISNKVTKTATTPVFETEWHEIVLDLFYNRRYIAAGAMPLTAADKAALGLWKDEPYTKQKLLYKYYDNDALRQTDMANGVDSYSLSLSANAQDFAAKWLAGTTSFRDSYPVIRGIQYYSIRPTSTSGGQFADTPPTAANAPAGYTWLRGPDRLVRGQRLWELHRIWTGAKYGVDWDLYA